MLLTLSAATGSTADGTPTRSPTPTPTPPHPARWESVDGPRVPVAGAAGVPLERGPALLGGFTDRLEATAAIQVRDPRHGWMPVGSALLEPRAEATAIPLPDDTVLVIGGWSGRLPDELRQLGSVERVDPWNPTRRRPIPRPFEDRPEAGLDGHAACRLPDGRVLLVHDHRGTVFDPASDAWSPPFRLAAPRHEAILVPLPPVSGDDAVEVVVIGGCRHPDDPAIETLRITTDAPASTISWMPWSGRPMPPTLARVAAIRVGGAILVAGGEMQGRSVSGTWRLDPRARTGVAGPDLPMVEGVAGGRLLRAGARVVLLGGESIQDGRPVPVPHGAVLHPRLDRVWPLPNSPASAVRVVVLGGGGIAPEVIGGYRFDSTASRGGRTRVLADDFRLRLPTLLIDD